VARVLKLLSILVFSVVALCITGFFLYHTQYFLAVLALFITIMTLVIFNHPKAYPFRFMYPGLITFLLFMILPITFTILIGFTNLSTGHLLTQKKVYEILRNEIVQTDIKGFESQNFAYKLATSDKKLKYTLYLLDEKTNRVLTANVDLNDVEKTYKLETSQEGRDFFNSGTFLTPGTVFGIRESLSKMIFELPDQTQLKYFRTDYLIHSPYRFEELGDNKLREKSSGKVFYPDMKRGSFTDGTDTLSPGFFVTVGLKNFYELFSNPGIKKTFGKIMAWTMTWAIGTVLMSFAMGMLLALIVNNKKLKMKSFYRILLIVPYSIPFFISILIFKGMLNEDFGVVNEIIAKGGMAKLPWLLDPVMAKVSCLMVNLWLGYPYMFLIITGILQSIPESVYEAAIIDGAKRWATFTKITLPMIFSAVGPLLVGSFAFNLNNFVGIYLLTAGGPPIIGATTPAGETDILISYTYRLAFEGASGQDFGLASSIAMLIFVIITILTLINFKVSGMLKENQSR